MKISFYPRLAWDGIRKNRRMVIPYLLTCICMISMFYILAFLSSPATTSLLPRGRETASWIMQLGCFVIAVFSLIFLYYTNSFLIRRRAEEFGLYNVLGMSKRNLAKIITLENLIMAAISIFLGLLLGIALSKLAELGFIRITGGTVTYDFHVETEYVLLTILLYLAIFAVIWLSSIIRVSRSNTVTLLKSDKTGEKAPKANWLLGILGAVILMVAYYIAVTLENPIQIYLWFFLAVILVIVATYLLMISGSVLLCRILQKNRNYYYNPRHFVSVSSLVYRMKRNGAGLASIAIISTMVLVMISSTSCLWFGTKDMLNNLYPGDINYTVRFYKSELMNEDNLNDIRKVFEDFRIKNNTETENAIDLNFVESTGVSTDNTVDFGDFDEAQVVDRIRVVNIIPLSVYNQRTDQNVMLNEEEAIAFSSGCNVNFETLNLSLNGSMKSYRLVNSGEKKFYADTYMNSLVPQINLIVTDIDSVMKFFEEAQEDVTRSMSLIWKYSFNLKQSPLSKSDYAREAAEAVKTAMDNDENAGYYSIITEERETLAEEFMASNGSLFFIGVILSTVFIFAAILIIYYKQISEGYEDSSRFSVMKKVGMTNEEIKKSINSQLLVVFFIPLIFAGSHLVFAFPMIAKMLTPFGLYNKGLFLLTTLICYVVFAVFYAMIYKLTSNVYYNIVSDAK